MKTRFSHWIILIILLLALTACSTDQPTEVVTETPPEENIEQPPSEPGEEASYPVQEFVIPPVVDPSAYPITDEDLQMLIGSWSLTYYAENGKSMGSGYRLLRFNEDGTYEVSTESGSRTGEWTAKLYAVESMLILDPGTSNALTFRIDELTQAVLNLSITMNGVEIEEGYLPAE